MARATGPSRLREAIALHGSDIFIGGESSTQPASRPLTTWRASMVWHGLGSNGAGDGAIGVEVYSLPLRQHLYVARF